MWDEIGRLLPGFESAVLTGLDADGYPYSVRCRPWADSTTRVLRVQLLAYASIQAGPASLLCHEHDENLWNLRSFLVRGTIAREDSEWIFQPQRFVPGAGVEGTRGMVRFLTGSRRNAKRYLQKRGLSRPRIPWKAINEIKAQIKEDRRPASVPSGSSPGRLLEYQPEYPYSHGGTQEPTRREEKRLSSASGVMTSSIVVAIFVALITLLVLLRRRRRGEK